MDRAQVPRFCGVSRASPLDGLLNGVVLFARISHVGRVGLEQQVTESAEMRLG